MLNAGRIQRAQARMQEQGIDAYLILTHDDYIYFFGEDRFQPRAIIPAQGHPVVVTFVGEEEEVRQSLGIEGVKVFGTVGQQIRDVVGTMRQMAAGKEPMIVGVQMWFNTPAFLLNLFQRANPQVKVVDIASVMDDMRMVKDDSEVELMRRAAGVARVGIEAAVEHLRHGVTENEVGPRSSTQCERLAATGSLFPCLLTQGSGRAGSMAMPLIRQYRPATLLSWTLCPSTRVIAPT